MSGEFDAAVTALPADLKARYDTLGDEEKKQFQALKPELLELFLRLLGFNWSSAEKLSENVGAAVALVADATASGGPNDPKNESAATPWGWLVQQMKPSPGSAMKVARTWYRHLEAHDCKQGARSKNRGVAANLVGSLELMRGNVGVARRWLHIAAVEDARDDHKGAARTLLIESLGERADALDDLAAVVKAEQASISDFQSQAERLLTRWYLRQDLRRSDVSLDAEHDLNSWLLEKLVDDLTGQHANTKEQGDALEDLAAYLLAHIVGCFPVKKSETPDFENDLVIRNLSRHVSPALDVLGRYFLVECKNWKDRVGSHEIAYFASRMRYCRLRFGVLFAREGITGDGEGDTKAGKGEGGRFMLNRAYHQDGVVIAVVTANDLRQVAGGAETPLQLLLRKHDEVRFGSWSPG